MDAKLVISQKRVSCMSQKIMRLVEEVENVKYRHLTMCDSLLELNKKWTKLNDNQMRAYAERRDRDVTRYDVLIRSNVIDTQRLYKKLDQINVEIKNVTKKLNDARNDLDTYSKEYGIEKRSKHIPVIICGSNPEAAILLKQQQLSGRKRRALVRCLELLNDLKWGKIYLSTPSEKQRSDEIVRRRFKCEELYLQIKFMQHQQKKLEKLDIKLFNTVLDDIKRTIPYVRYLRSSTASLNEIQSSTASLNEIQSSTASLIEIQSSTASLNKIQSSTASLNEIQSSTASLNEMQSSAASLDKIQAFTSYLDEEQNSISSLDDIQSSTASTASVNEIESSAVFLKKIQSFKAYLDQIQLTVVINVLSDSQ